MMTMWSRLRRWRAAVSTVLGTLIFVGVLMTAVIPLYVYVNQVNNLYDATVVAMDRFDQERDMENLEVYAYPYTADYDNQVKVFIKNRCSLEVRIVRIWINDDYTSITVNATISPMEDYTFGPFNTTLPTEGSQDYYIKATTRRGNVFSALTNPLTYTAGAGGGWSGSTALSFNIVIEGHFFYRYRILVTGTDFTYDNQVRLGLGGSVMLKVDVPDLGTYHVTITREWWGHATLIDQDYTITVDEPSIWVYATDD